MRTPSPVAAGGFYLQNGIPDEYYAFTGGEISMTVERNGGINTIKVLDILRHEGKLYPDRCPTPPIITKEGRSCGKRPVYGPGIQFISTNRQPNGRAGRNLFHVPDRMELYPFGFVSESERFGHRTRYDLCIDGRMILFRFANAFPTRERLLMTLNKDHVVDGEMGSMKNQVREWILQYGLDQAGLDPNRPFLDDYKMTLTWDFIGLDEKAGAFVMDGRMKRLYGEKKVVVMVAASRPMEVQALKTRYVFSCPWDRTAGNDEIRMCLAVAESREEARRQAEEGNRRFEEICAARIRENVEYSLQAPSVCIETAPHAAEFSRTVPAFEQAMLLADNRNEICIRAAAHKFGYFAAWDHIYPVKAFLIMGDYETARKLLRYMLTLEGIEPMTWQILQLIIAVEELVACSGDREFLKETYATLKHYFEFLAKAADPTTGLIAFVNGCGVDDPEELGVEGKVWFPCLNGWWYDECRAMENLALIMSDSETAAAARTWGQKIDTHFMEVFYDPAKGYLHSVVEPKTRKTTGVYQNVSTIALDYPHGEYLLRKHLREIAEYQAYGLYHPAGRSAVAYDDNAHEMWKNVIMLQHLAHETKAARAAGMGDEALRITNNYLQIFNRCKVGIETQNIVGCDGDISQRANWQAFGARACYGAIVEGVVGIQWDLGGFHYVPCEIEGDMTIREFPFRRTRWNIRVTGEGAYVGQVLVDAVPLQGSLRVPAHLLEGEGTHQLEIVRSRKPFTRPTLLSAVGASVTELKSSERELSFGVAEKVRAIVKVYSPAQPGARLDQQTVPVEWNAETRIGWCDLAMAPGQRLTISAITMQ